MTFLTILPYLIPILQGLWELLKPTMRKLLERLWVWVEAEIDSRIDELDKPAAEVKAALFNEKAKELYFNSGKEISNADLNLVREVIHTKMKKKVQKNEKN